MKLSFTGSRKGMTPQQRKSFIRILEALKPTELHQGLCEGADAQASIIFVSRNIKGVLVGYPCDEKGTPQVAPDIIWKCCNELKPIRSPLKRNHDIVDAGDMLVATPKEDHEVVRSGTWATVRYARKQGKRVVVIWPNGFAEG